MTTPAKDRKTFQGIIIRRHTLTACGMLLAALLIFTSSSSAQIKTLYNFAGATSDGATPYAGLLIGTGNVLYGTTTSGGTSKHGIVFSLSPPTSPGGSWTEAVLHSFKGGTKDGANPYLGALVADANGVLYGTTEYGGAANKGVVFSLTPPASEGGSWTEDVLYAFAGGNDGANPFAGLTMDSSGVLYGTTSAGGPSGSGTVFSLTPPASQGGSWTEEVIYSFTGFGDGATPYAGVVIGTGETLYGTTTYGGAANDGTIYALTPPASQGGAWTKTTLYSFSGLTDGAWPAATVIGSGGVLYGTTQAGGTSGRGTVYSLTPPASQGGSPSEAVLYNFTGGLDGFAPYSSLTVNSSGILYGTTEFGGHSGTGVIFSMTPPAVSGGSWTESVLYSFTGLSDGGWPVANVVIGTGGLLYGVTSSGGTSPNGTAYQFTVASYTISGKVTLGGSGLSGVTVTLSGSQTGTSTTDGSGNYSFTLQAGGTYTITPSLAGYAFTPSSQTFNNLSANQTVDFTAVPTYTISGQVTLSGSGLSGVTMTLSGSQSGSTTTDTSGNYSFTVPGSGSYTITPSWASYTFTPPSKTFNNLSGNQVANFVATAPTYTISGQVTLSGSALSGVTMTLSGSQSGSTTTDGSGNYSFSVQGGGNYTVTPSLTGYMFAPPSQSYTNLADNQTANFSASPVVPTYTISGQVILSGNGLAGVTVKLTGSQGATAVTNSTGNYSFTVHAGGNYTVTPLFSGYIFSPPNQSFNNLSANQTANFIAKVPSDFNGDGHPDVVWEEPVVGWAQVWYLGGSQGVTLTGAANVTQTNPWQVVGVGDFDGNGIPDLVWQDPVSGAVQVWYLGGAGGVTLVSAVNITNKNAWHVVSVGDFNQDGHPDLLWQDPNSGWAQIWYLTGSQGNTLSGAANLTLSNKWRVVGTGDFNNDGFLDVLWQDPVSGTVQLWYMAGSTPGAQGTQFVSAVNLTGPMTTKVAAIADFNRDGHPDVVFQDPASGAATVYYYTGSQGTTPDGTAVLSTGNPWYIAGPR